MKIGNLLETPCKYFPPEEAGNVSVQIECLCWWHAGRTSDLFCYSETSSFVPRLSSPPLLLHSVASTNFGMLLLFHLVFSDESCTPGKNDRNDVASSRSDVRTVEFVLVSLVCIGILMPLRCLGPNPYRSPNELLL